MDPSQTPFWRGQSPLFEPETTLPCELYSCATPHNMSDLSSQLHGEMAATPRAPATETHVSSFKEDNDSIAVEDSDSLKRKVDQINFDMAEDIFANDEYEFVEPHDPDSEPLPNLPIYHPAVRTVETLCTRLVERFQVQLKESNFQDGETNYLLDEFNSLERPPHENDVIRIGLHGDAGQGKSSLLNSILGYENLAIHADDGNSCTYVVQEYVQASPTQKTPFQAEIEFFSRPACLEFVKELFSHFYTHMTTTDELDEDESHENRLRSTTAVMIFTALFMGREECCDKEATETFLSRALSKDDPRVLNKLIRWTEDILEKLLPNGSNEDVTCLESRLGSSIDRSSPAVYHDGSISEFRRDYPAMLSLGSCQMRQDLPGTSDINRSRVSATKRYMQSCDITIVVGKLGRAIDHASLHNQINDAFKRRRSGSIIVVCTHSDDININAKQTFAFTAAEEKELADIAVEEGKVNEHLRTVKNQLSSREGKRDHLLRLRLINLKDQYDREKQSLQRHRVEVRVLARNRHVREGITEQYRLDTKDTAGQLPIHGVSNTIYMQHLSGYHKKSPPNLTLNATGIPQVRNEIYSLPANARFQGLLHYCRTSLETALNMVEISCSQSKLKRKEDLNKSFHKARNSVSTTVRDISEQFCSSDVQLIFSKISENESEWINRARRKCEKWSKLPAAGHRAVMKHSGSWGTKKCPPQDWNEELLGIIREDLDPIFEMLHNDACIGLATEIAERVNETIEHLNRTLKTDPSANLSRAIFAFRKNLKERKNQINRICDLFREETKKFVRTLQAHATTVGEGHYLVEAMEEIYDIGNNPPKVRGCTQHISRCDVFQKALCAHGGVFMKVSEGISNGFNESFQGRIEKLIAKLDDIFKKIQHDVDQVCSTKEDDSPEAKQMREDLLAMLPDARELLWGDINRSLDRCRKLRE